MVAQTNVEIEHQLVARAVDDLVRRTRFPLAFGGVQRRGAVEVTATAGMRTGGIGGLIVQAQRGLGGRAMTEKRPRLTMDYRTSRVITHDYDGPILAEGISSLFAVPVVVTGLVRAVLYVGSRSHALLGGRAPEAAVGVATSLAEELRIRDEVERRIAERSAHLDMGQTDAATRERLREAYAELRGISAAVADPEVRDRLRTVERSLAALSRGETSPAADIRLTARETDVLAQVALGATNAEIATRLGLKAATVKAYLQSAMAKLGASTRHSAVANGRRVGLLP